MLLTGRRRGQLAAKVRYLEHGRVAVYFGLLSPANLGPGDSFSSRSRDPQGHRLW